MTSSKSPSEGHSLDSFLSHYTSEDNNSFQELIETADKKLRQRFAVLYEAETSTAAAIANSLELPSIENQFRAIEGNKQVYIVVEFTLVLLMIISSAFFPVGHVEIHQQKLHHVYSRWSGIDQSRAIGNGQP